MRKDLTLSEMVQSYIDSLDWEGDPDMPPEERIETRKNRRLVEFIGKRQRKHTVDRV